MKSKSFPRLAVTVSILALGLTLAGDAAVPTLSAQATATPSPTSSPPASKPKFGHVRCWNAFPLGSPTFELVLGAAPNDRTLQSSPPQNFYATYIAVPPGQYAVRIIRAGDRQNSIKSFNLPLRDKNYFTLFITQAADGQPAIELLDETADPAKTTPNRVTVRQFCAGATAIITAGGKRTQPLPFGGVETLEGLPNGLVPLIMRATLPSGTSKVWNTEADFRASHRATVFITMDPYKRMRTRVTVDGPSVEQEAEDAAEDAADHIP